ncbi:low molecular weight protein-tyrosine-phosphatase [Paenibacillus segetis]|uniref:protein-tyrosine-phosphatase n=1 Tax=Paenibacillus segetis TaxID=1325360 RepID=A0ABQ1YAX9_9BACL|nr:low molecular weight protein-tyrosine-phosphatase [Paenibacillus segetis]GGH19117.1 phosphotyrosine protein phosphatase [Paenibacillus segetis]
MIKVLFVCLGNICRSPMAEAVFRNHVKNVGLSDRIVVDSAGTGDWHVGHTPHEGTRKILDQYGIDYSGMFARQVSTEDFNDFKYIIAMDDMNVTNLTPLFPTDHQAEVKKLLEFVPKHAGGDVPDPYYTGNFEEVYEMVDEGCVNLLKYIREQQGL